jgi:hypothetical protein
VEGGKVAERLLASRLRVRSLLLTEEWFDRLIECAPGEGDPGVPDLPRGPGKRPSLFPSFTPRPLPGILADLRSRRGTLIIRADAGPEKELHEVELRGNICCVAGNEEAGLSAEIRALGAERVWIPMGNGVDPLDVASAVTVFLYAASRQRTGG